MLDKALLIASFFVSICAPRSLFGAFFRCISLYINSAYLHFSLDVMQKNRRIGYNYFDISKILLYLCTTNCGGVVPFNQRKQTIYKTIIN